MSAEQLDLESYRAAETSRRRDSGLAAAQHGDQEGYQLAREAIHLLAASGREFEGADVRPMLAGVTSNAVGSAFRSAAAEGEIEVVGYTPSRSISRHGALTRIWRGTP